MKNKILFYSSLFVVVCLVTIFASMNEPAKVTPEVVDDTPEQTSMVDSNKNPEWNTNSQIYVDDYALDIAKKEEPIKEEEVPAKAVEEEARKPEVTNEEIKEEVKEEVKEETKVEETVTEESTVNETALVWPVTGEIVLDYSSDVAIYDATLDQYKTNDSISIKADLGSDVMAVYGGEVTHIGHTTEDGNTITIAHEGGLKTTYSQLSEAVLVQVGSIVSRGDIIAYVGEPTIYKTALGSHLDFKVYENEVAVNPRLAFN